MSPGPSNIADILSRARISEVYRAIVGIEPRRTGRNTWRAPAVWRNGDGYSVALDDSKGVFHDFVTHEGGGLLRFVQTLRGCTKPEAVRWLADFAGVPLNDRPLTRDKRIAYACEREANRSDLITARHWRRATMSLAEETLVLLKAFGTREK